jgi:cysteine-rich repeat protein
MRRRSFPPTELFIVAALVLLAACGGGNDGSGFKDCGNGVLDGNEECDDGNLIDNDACLSTCTFNVCGDEFLNQPSEQCEQGVFAGATCTSLGFASGTLACSPQCTFDTSGCTGTTPPTPTPVATSAGTVSPGPGATPTAAPTPVGAACQAGDQVTVVAALDKTYGAALIDVGYPASLNIPGTGTAQSVADRVTFANAGLTTVNDTDKNGGDQVDDTLTASFVSFADHAPGTFATITFDCVTGQAPPTASALTCTVVSASSGGGVAIPDESCSVTVQ